MDLTLTPLHWFTTYLPNVSRPCININEILSLDTVKSPLRNNVYALRDLLDSLENFLRGWASISETSSHLSKLFLDQPLTIDLFMILLPKEIFHDDTHEELGNLESSQTLGAPATVPIHRLHTNTYKNGSNSLPENHNDLDLASQASDMPEVKAAEELLASTSSIVSFHNSPNREGSLGHLSFLAEIDGILLNRHHHMLPEEIIKTTKHMGTSYTSLARIGELLGSGISSLPSSKVPIAAGITSAATEVEPNNSKSPEDYLDTRKSSGSTDYGYHYTRRAFSMEDSPSTSMLPYSKNFDTTINPSLAPVSRSVSGSESSAMSMRGDRGFEVRCLSPVFHFELGSPC